jgi:hypothetical protein
MASSAGRADLALQFFRFAYRQGGFRPEGGTFTLLVPALASRRMLNHARCLVLHTMPSFSVTLDDTMPSFSVALEEPTHAAAGEHRRYARAGRRARALVRRGLARSEF